MCFDFFSNNQTLQQGWAPYNWRSISPQSQIVAVQKEDLCRLLANRGTVHEDLRIALWVHKVYSKLGGLYVGFAEKNNDDAIKN